MPSRRGGIPSPLGYTSQVWILVLVLVVVLENPDRFAIRLTEQNSRRTSVSLRSRNPNAPRTSTTTRTIPNFGICVKTPTRESGGIPHLRSIPFSSRFRAPLSFLFSIDHKFHFRKALHLRLLFRGPRSISPLFSGLEPAPESRSQYKPLRAALSRLLFFFQLAPTNCEFLHCQMRSFTIRSPGPGRSAT